MKSIPLALTWEFWRQAWSSLAICIVSLIGQLFIVYGTTRLYSPTPTPDAILAIIHLVCFLFIVMGLAATICYSAPSPQYGFTLPISMRMLMLVPVLNSIIATVVGYLTIALFANWVFDAQWPLAEPTLIAVCIVSVSQASTWMFEASAHLRGSHTAALGAIGAIIAMFTSFRFVHVPPDQILTVISPLTVCLAILIPTSSYILSLCLFTFARRGQVISLPAVGHWLVEKLDITLTARTHKSTPMTAELWVEWTRCGIVMPMGSIFFTVMMCVGFLSGRFEWRSGLGVIGALTCLLAGSGAIFGLILGHVGEQFDFNEHLATRPLSDRQLADIKLWNTWKSVAWTWVAWAFGVVVMVACLSLVGNGPTDWSDIAPSETHPLMVIGLLLLIVLSNWTLTSLAVSDAILRARAVKRALIGLSVSLAVPLLFLLFMRNSSAEILLVTLWCWNVASIIGVIAIYVAAFRLQLITARRIAVVGAGYLVLLAIVLSTGFLANHEAPPVVGIGILLSTCLLPFVCFGAVPLAIWWNRHR